jgi:pyridoxamine 5'-phosphate oxidase
LAEKRPFLAICLCHQVLSMRLGFTLIRRDVPNQGIQREIDLFGSWARVGFYNTFAARSHKDKVDCESVGVVETTVLALATADAHGHASNRIVRVESVTADGLTFTSHASSRKGRDIVATAWGSGVLYWRETQQQIIFSGSVARLSNTESDILWAKRPIAAQATSVVSHQSAPLDDEQKLRVEAQRLIHVNEPLPRPERWSGYRLVPATVEFWYGSLDRLHHRLRYDRVGDHWSAIRLQP